MYEIWVTLLAPIITGLILLLVEYWVIHPIKHSENSNTSNNQSTQSNLPTKKLESGEKTSPEFINFYHKLAVGLLGVLSGIAVSILLRLQAANYAVLHPDQMLSSIASLIATSDFCFFILIFFSAVGGGVTSVAVDFAASDSAIVFWLRLVTAIIFGFIGGALSLIAILLSIIGLIAYSMLTDERRQIEKNSSL